MQEQILTKNKSTVVYYLCLVLLLSPLVYSNSAVYGTVVHRTLFFWFWVDVLFVVFLIDKLQAKVRIGISHFQLVMIVNLLVILVSNVAGYSWYQSFFPSFERMMGFTSIFHFYLYFIILSSYKFTNKQWTGLYIGLAGIGVVVGAIGLAKMGQEHVGRVTALQGNPMHAAIYMISLLFIVLGGIDSIVGSSFTKSKSIRVGIIATLLSVMLFFTFIVIQTLTRAGFYSLIIGLFVTFFLYFLNTSGLRRWTLVVIGSVVGLIVSVFLYKDSKFVVENRFLYQFTELNFQTSSILSRLQLWDMIKNNLKERFLLGWGQENFIYFYAKYYMPTMYNADPWYDSSHNIFLDKLVTLGIIGLLAYILLLVSYLYLLWRKATQLTLWKKSVFTGYLIAYIFFLNFGFDSFVSLFFFFGIIIYIFQHSDREEIFAFSLTPFSKKLAFIVGCIMSVSSIYFLVIKTYQTNSLVTKAHTTQDLLSLVTTYKKASEDVIVGKFDVALQFAMKHTYLRNNTSIKDRDKIFFKDNLQIVYRNTYRDLPENPILVSQYGFALWSCGDIKGAISVYEKMRELSPQRQANLIALGNLYLNNKQFAKASDTFEKAYFVDTTYRLPLFYLAYCKAQLNDISGVDTYMKFLTSREVKENMDLVYSIFSTNNRYDDYFRYLDVLYKDEFRIETYAYWAEKAKEHQNYEAIKIAVVSFYFHYNIPNRGERADSWAMKQIMGNSEPVEKTFKELYAYRLSLSKK